MLYTIVGILVIILDQAVKLYVTNTFTETGETVKTLIPGVVSLVRVQNDGAAFSFLAGGGARIWFIILTLIFVGLVIVALATNFISGKFGRWCMVIVAAGGLANCIDRVLYGYVVDMFRIDLFDFAVFNVADIFITVGCIAFILYILFGGEKEPDPNADEFDEEDDESLDKPVRKPLFKKKGLGFIKADDDEDEEDEDDLPREPDLVLKARAQALAQKEAQSRRTAEEEAAAFEEFFKKRAESKGTVVKPTVKKTASAKNEAIPAKKPVASVPVVEEDDFIPVKKQPKIEPKTVAVEIVEEEPVSKPAPTPVKAPSVTVSSDDEFDLDSILNEFK